MGDGDDGPAYDTDFREHPEEYRAAGEFVGMDMARKYLQMGWTRSSGTTRRNTPYRRCTGSTSTA